MLEYRPRTISVEISRAILQFGRLFVFVSLRFFSSDYWSFWISLHRNLRRLLEANSEADLLNPSCYCYFHVMESKSCGGHRRPTRRPPLNSILLLWFYRQVVVYTDLNILLLKECMHHFGVKILEFSPGGAGETFTIQRQQAFMMQNSPRENS